jgi:hypothetical protein
MVGLDAAGKATTNAVPSGGGGLPQANIVTNSLPTVAGVTLITNSSYVGLGVLGNNSIVSQMSGASVTAAGGSAGLVVPTAGNWSLVDQSGKGLQSDGSGNVSFGGVLSGNGGGLTNIYVSSLVISTNAAPQTNTIVGFFWLTNGVNVYKIPVLQ